ncbi:MAG: low molecular weight protein-tyrosine-phosphatase [Rickettsiales bacterium]|nr:low molecular weight protein-tyrosine-phosphatase [Rickettsiales bacterium]
MKKKILFVCLGNICRSPTAQGIFEHFIKNKNLEHKISVDSAGTSGWHKGSPPDRRSIEHAANRGYDLTRQKSRQIEFSDFFEFDLIIAMDKANYEDLKQVAPREERHKIKLFLREYGDNKFIQEVPDPYHKGSDGFEEVLDLLESACLNLIEELERE